jgi:hypothetical protein
MYASPFSLSEFSVSPSICNLRSDKFFASSSQLWKNGKGEVNNTDGGIELENYSKRILRS